MDAWSYLSSYFFKSKASTEFIERLAKLPAREELSEKAKP
jgi:hypothetical protein